MYWIEYTQRGTQIELYIFVLGMATAGERLAQADLFKAEGNEHFKVGKYKKALVSYGKCVAYAKCLPGTYVSRF